MGTTEELSPAKKSKTTSTQETPPPSYLDWSSSMQTLNFGSGAVPSFFASSIVTTPAPHPYMWGDQHPMMPPYVCPPAGVYGHPGMPMSDEEMETKVPIGKDKVNEMSKGTSGNVNATGVRTGESEKTASSSRNDSATQSGKYGSSDASDEDNKQEVFGGKKGSFYQILADANARNNNSGPNVQTSVPGNPIPSMPATNLHIGMDPWNQPPGPGSRNMQPNYSGVSQPVARPPIMNDYWVQRNQRLPLYRQQDERELKRQKRMQSNRESAQRSRLRKQAECEELQARVAMLSNENHSLRDELQRLSEGCGKLIAENDSIKDELTKFLGPEAVSKLDAHLESQTNKGDS